MLRIIKAMGICIDADNFKSESDIIRDECPGIYNIGPSTDHSTAMVYGDDVTGCRGITCHECWHKPTDA